jgi:hypothetical protein
MNEVMDGIEQRKQEQKESLIGIADLLQVWVAQNRISQAQSYQLFDMVGKVQTQSFELGALCSYVDSQEELADG